MTQPEKQEDSSPPSSAELHTEKSSTSESSVKQDSTPAIIRGQIHLARFEGPIPPPETLQQYENVLPGSAERILKMVENQSLHRQEMEKRLIGARCRDSLWGIVAGVIAVLAFATVAWYAIIKGHPTAATFLGTGTIVGIVSVFIYGTRASRKEQDARAKTLNNIWRRES